MQRYDIYLTFVLPLHKSYQFTNKLHVLSSHVQILSTCNNLYCCQKIPHARPCDALAHSNWQERGALPSPLAEVCLVSFLVVVIDCFTIVTCTQSSQVRINVGFAILCAYRVQHTSEHGVAFPTMRHFALYV